MSESRQYLLSIYQPYGDGPPPPPERLAEIGEHVARLRAELRAAGAWVFANGLLPPATATVVRVRDGETVVTDGAYVEAEEHLGGISIINAPDLDAALTWARKLAEATTLPIEVRPFHEAGSP